MNLQDQIMEQANQTLVEHYDFEVLAGLLDWHRIDLDRLQDNRHAVDITH